MNYILSTKDNNYDIVSYDHDNSADYKTFLKGMNIPSSEGPFLYNIVRPADFKKIKKFNWLSSTGPDLISQDFRKILEETSSEDVQFFDALIMYEDETIEGFSVLNITKKVDCLNMQQSEYKLTNFDPQYPTYRFYYQVVNDSSLSGNIVRCNESPTNIIISNSLKNAISSAGLKNFSFCKSIDITPQNRSRCEFS